MLEPAFHFWNNPPLVEDNDNMPSKYTKKNSTSALLY